MAPSEWIYLFTDYFGRYSHRRWMAHFGFGPHLCSELLKYLGEDFQPINLLMALYFLKNYPITDIAHNLFRCSEKTYCQWIWKVLFRLKEILDNV